MPPGSRVLLTSRSEAVVQCRGTAAGLPCVLFDSDRAFQLLFQEVFGIIAPPDDFTAVQWTRALTICSGLLLVLCVIGRKLKNVGPNFWQVPIYALHNCCDMCEETPQISIQPSAIWLIAQLYLVSAVCHHGCNSSVIKC